MTSYENGFLRKCAEYEVDPMTVIDSSRKLSKAERKALLAALPETRRKYIRKFLYEVDGHDPKRYIVRGKDANRNVGEYTYIPDEDKLLESRRQRQINDTNRMFRRLALLHWL